MKRWLLASCLTFSGCAMNAAVSQNGVLILKPQITRGQLTQTIVTPYDKASIHHLTLKLFNGAVDTGISKTLLNAQLDNAVVFSNLKDHATYRVKAYAYASTDDSLLISFDDANSWTDITLTDDDRPTVGNLKVKLIDKAFDGQATASGLTVSPGSYIDAGPEAMGFLSAQGIVTTFAGNGSTVFTDGTGTAATFFNPYGVALDSKGNLYVAEYSGQRIRKITPQGVVSTFAGNGTASYANGVGVNAMFTGPYAIAVDPSDNLYVSDAANNRIRKITPDGTVSTYAGNGSATCVDGTGMAASFSMPRGITIDKAGNLYLSDHNVHRIRKITPGGVVSTFAGNGTNGTADGANGTFYYPAGLAADANDNIYVADQMNHRVRKITPAGVVSTIAGNGTVGAADGQGVNATFNSLRGIAVDALGYLYIGDFSNNRIRRISPSGNVYTLAGNGGTAFADGTSIYATFNWPGGLAVDATGNVYVADYNNQRIRKIQ